MLATTATTPDAGTGPWPATATFKVPPGATVCPAQGVGLAFDRVSQMREGVAATNRAPVWASEDPSVNQPLTSTIRSTEVLVVKDTWPPDPTGTMTRLGTFWPEEKLRFEALGAATPAG